ncbi:Superfamily I DNA and/or RNA helicase [Ruminococcus flavefaciens]|uniref:Superfamily I DNA and/or RNA helicase n=1 Tax=Ruminococcus flavefaciens TaxID=1265 RepID=A0A1H6KFZ4_RUMFL|nr:AAA domain-containing protein [Ruminococcus flavefaciens]SEH74070.1 Superfamily I DNA and/or RNA helicase [Ruminococcus flavefaciens]
MELIGLKVVHKTFKNGVITGHQGNIIIVKFKENGNEMKFLYPDCFKTYLTLENSNAIEKVKFDTASKIEQEKIKKENERIQRENNRIISEMNRSKTKGSVVKDTPVIRFKSYNEFCDHYSQKIASEVAFLRRNGGKRITVYDGRYLSRQGLRFSYEFDTDTELNYPDGTQITLYVSLKKDSVQGEVEVKGILENCSEFTVIISTDADLGHSEDTEISSLEFSVESWRLLNTLNERLVLLRNKNNYIADALVTQGFNQIEYGAKLSTGQETAVDMTLKQPITFIWGPPGSGKTETLAKIAIQHIKKGNKILMLSYSNVSVDAAIQRVFKLFPQSNLGDILRYGYPKDNDINESQFKSSFNFALYLCPELVKKRKDLMNESKKYGKTDPKRKEISKKIREIREALAEKEIDSIKKARFVATTVSKAVVDKKLTEIPFDVVIFDEASMSYIPQIIFGASLAKKHFVCMGDYCQLPPIVQGDRSESLSVDIFRYCGISDAVERNCGHKWLCMLDIQYRMHPEIANFASVTMYHGLLKTASGIKEKRDEIQEAVPELKKAYGIADLSYMMSTCIPMKDHSRVNILSAFISFALAERAYNNGFNVGIIAPYTSQAGLLNSMALDMAEKIGEKRTIPCATVHQFQGSEQDVIVYDATDCYRQTYPGILLTSTKDNYANKLFNVAMTRARGKFVAVTNAKYMIDKGVKTNLMFGQLISKSRVESGVDGYSLEYFKTDVDSCLKFYRQANAGDAFLDDISAANKLVYIDIPDKPMNDTAFYEKLIRIIDEKKKNNVKVVIRAEKRSSLPLSIRSIAIEHSFSMNPVAVIDKSVTWYGMPWSEAVFKTENGSIQTKFHPIIRFAGRKASRKIYGLLEMNKTTDESVELLDEEEPNTLAQYILKHEKCPICNKPMQMKKSKSGKFFLSCTGYPACTQTSFLSVDLVEEYLYVPKPDGSKVLVARCKCNKCDTSLEAKLGQYGLYIQCCGLNRHKYKPDEI